MANERIYRVDRTRDDDADLVSDDGELVDVSRSQLPEDTEMGSIVVVPIGDDGKPDWSAARLDDEERARRERASREILDQLRGGRREPPGG